MDAFCVGMYRACSTWQYEVVCHLLEARGGCRRLGYLDGHEYAPAADGIPAVLKSHDKHPRLGQALARRRAMAVYAYRDVRDVAFSMQHKMGVPLDRLVRQGLLHRILANDRYWTSRPGVIVQRDEDLMADPARGVEELAAHLGIAPDPGEAAAIAAEYSLEANRRRTEAAKRVLQVGGIDPADQAQRLRYDGRTLLHWNHLREGNVGGWRESATPRQVALLGRMCGPWLVEKGYEPDESWWTAPDRLSPAALRVEAARSRLHGTIYFTARRHPRVASALRRALGLARPDSATAIVPPAVADALPVARRPD